LYETLNPSACLLSVLEQSEIEPANWNRFRRGALGNPDNRFGSRYRLLKKRRRQYDGIVLGIQSQIPTQVMKISASRTADNF